MVTPKSVHTNELFWFVEFPGTILAMGITRFFRYTGQYDLGGFDGHGRWAHLLLFGGRFSETTRWNENSKDSAIFVRKRDEPISRSLLFMLEAIIFRCFNLYRKKLFNEHMDDPNYVPLPEERDRPGGFNWGGEGLNAQQPNQRPEQQQQPQQPPPNQ